MTKYWKLTHNYDGYELSVRDDISKQAAYLYRHGDFFSKQESTGEFFSKHESTFRRAVNDPSVNDFLTDVQQNLSGEFIYRLVEDNYKTEMFSNHGIDAQLNDALRLRLQGISEVSIANARYHSEFDDTWADVPKPWRNKDAYLVGKDDKYKITIAPIGNTNNIIKKADRVFQLTSNGEWTNDKNVAVISQAPHHVDAGHPTFEVNSRYAKNFLELVENDTNWSEIFNEITEPKGPHL